MTAQELIDKLKALPDGDKGKHVEYWRREHGGPNYPNQQYLEDHDVAAIETVADVVVLSDGFNDGWANC